MCPAAIGLLTGAERITPASSVVMGRDALNAFDQHITGGRLTDVAQAEHADHPFATVDDRQPAEVQLLHVPDRLSKVIVLPAAMNAWGHHIARRGTSGIEAVISQPFADDVTVGHDADQPVVLADWNGAYIVLTHQFREFGDGGVRANPLDAHVHRFFDFHGGPLSLELGALDNMPEPIPAALCLDYITARS